MKKSPHDEYKLGHFLNPIIGDIWQQIGYKVISTNLGGVHGRGLAAQARGFGYITSINKNFDSSPIRLKTFHNSIICIAVKGRAPETAKIPGQAYSEQTTAGNLDLLRTEILKLSDFAIKHPNENIYVPFIGLGFGEGKYEEIAPILSTLNNLPNIFFIAKDKATETRYASTFKPGVRRDRNVTVV